MTVGVEPVHPSQAIRRRFLGDSGGHWHRREKRWGRHWHCVHKGHHLQIFRSRVFQLLIFKLYFKRMDLIQKHYMILILLQRILKHQRIDRGVRRGQILRGRRLNLRLFLEADILWRDFTCLWKMEERRNMMKRLRVFMKNGGDFSRFRRRIINLL